MQTRSRNHSPDTSQPRPVNLTPTEMIRKFREQVLRGNITMPFQEGVTPAQRDHHATTIRSKLA